AAESRLARYPKVDPSRAHGVVAVELAPGATYQIWAAPLDDGSGACPIIQWVDAKGVTRGGSWGSGMCVTSTTPKEPRVWGANTNDAAHGRVVRPGSAPGAASVELRFADGRSVRGPVVDGFFLVPSATPYVGGLGPRPGGGLREESP